MPSRHRLPTTTSPAPICTASHTIVASDRPIRRCASTLIVSRPALAVPAYPTKNGRNVWPLEAFLPTVPHLIIFPKHQPARQRVTSRDRLAKSARLGDSPKQNIWHGATALLALASAKRPANGVEQSAYHYHQEQQRQDDQQNYNQDDEHDFHIRCLLRPHRRRSGRGLLCMPEGEWRAVTLLPLIAMYSRSCPRA